jgi:hypothetical protein
MKIGAGIKNVLTLAIVGGCIYAFVKWEFDQPQDGDNSEYAEQACADEIRNRFATTSVNVYSVSKTNNGYTARASAILARGVPAKFVCLTNEYGAVVDIRAQER